MALQGFDDPTNPPAFQLPDAKVESPAPAQQDEPQVAFNYASETGALGPPGSNLVSVTDKQGHTFTVNRAAAKNFEGFFNELEDRGYKINSLSGYSPREKRGGGLSEHAWGNAVDVDPGQNPYLTTKTEFHPEIRDIGKKYGIQWGMDIKHPGPDPMHFEYDPRSRLATVGTQLANNSPPGATDATTGQSKPPPAPVDLSKLTNWGDEADHPAHQPLPPGTAGGTNPDYAGMMKNWDEHKPLIEDSSRYGVAPSPTVIQQLGHLATYMPAFSWYMATTALTWPFDLANLATKGLEWGERKLGLNPKSAPPIGAFGFTETPEETKAREAYEQQQEAKLKGTPLPGPELPNPDAGRSPIVNFLKHPGSATLRNLGGAINPWQLPSEAGDPDSVARYFETFGLPAMQVAVGGFPGALRAGGGALKVASRTLGNAGTGAFVYGLGNELGQELTGSEGGTPAQQAAGLAASLALETLRVGASKGLTLGTKAAKQGLPTLFEKYIGGKVGPEANLKENIGGPEAQQEMLQNIKNYNPESVLPGFQTTAAAIGDNKPAQALLQLHRHTDRMSQARYDDILANNDRVLAGAGENIIPGGGGDVKSPVEFFRSELDRDRQAMEQHIIDAGREAKANYDAVVRHLGVGDDHVLAQEALGNAQYDAVKAAQQNLHAYANWRWDQARAAGVDELNINDAHAQDVLFSPLQRLMQEAIRRGQADHFPFDTVRRLYKGDPRQMFDGEGNLKPPPEADTKVITGFDPATGKVTFQTQGEPVNPRTNMSFGNVREVLSDLQNDLRIERRAVSNPNLIGDAKALGWNAKVVSTINDALDKILANSGTGNTAIYRLATGATALEHKLTSRGIVGKILGLDLEGGPGIAPATTLNRLIPGGIDGVGATRQLFDLIHAQQQLEGLQFPGKPMMHPADTLLQGIENHLRLGFGVAMHKGGPEAAQTFLENHSVALQAFPQLKDDMRSAIASGHTETVLQKGMADYDRQLKDSIPNLYAGGDVGKAIDTIVRSPDPRAEMGRHLDHAFADVTGEAPKGIARLFFKRLQAEAVHPITGEYVPNAATAFYNKNKGAFDELVDRGLMDRKSLDQTINSFKMSDKLRETPDTILYTPESAKLSLPWLTDKAFRMVGGKFGRAFNTGTLQVPQMFADIFERLGQGMFSKLSSRGAKQLQADLLFDKEKMEQFLEGTKRVIKDNDHRMLDGLLTPYVKAYPWIVVGQTSKNLEPTTQPDPTNYISESPTEGENQ